MAKLLLENGMRDLINSPDSLGNTCLHALIVRYALEESRFSVYHEDYPPWSRWDGEDGLFFFGWGSSLFNVNLKLQSST